jgi:hypothetical protein
MPSRDILGSDALVGPSPMPRSTARSRRGRSFFGPRSNRRVRKADLEGVADTHTQFILDQPPLPIGLQTAAEPIMVWPDGPALSPVIEGLALLAVSREFPDERYLAGILRLRIAPLWRCPRLRQDGECFLKACRRRRLGIPVIEQAKIQAQVLVPLIKSLQTELGEQRANALVRKALGAR